MEQDGQRVKACLSDTFAQGRDELTWIPSEAREPICHATDEDL
jgi:hypothetical protein